jgi:hypothetical protein
MILLPARQSLRSITTMDRRTSAAVDWLLSCDEPAVRRLAQCDLLDEPAGDPELVLSSPKVRGLLAGQQPDGGFGRSCYQKWTHGRIADLLAVAGRWMELRPPGQRTTFLVS